MQRRQPVGATLPTVQTILTRIGRSVFENCGVFRNVAALLGSPIPKTQIGEENR